MSAVDGGAVSEPRYELKREDKLFGSAGGALGSAGGFNTALLEAIVAEGLPTGGVVGVGAGGKLIGVVGARLALEIEVGAVEPVF